MFANPEEALLQLRSLLGPEGSLVIARPADGAILAGELRSGRSILDGRQANTNLLDLLPPWQRQDFRTTLANLSFGWQEHTLTLYGQSYKTLVLRVELGRTVAAALHLKPVEGLGDAETTSLTFLMKAGVKTAVYLPQHDSITWLTEQKVDPKPDLEEEFALDDTQAEQAREFHLTGVDLKAIMQITAGTGQPFRANSLWSDTANQSFDLEVWPELSMGHVQRVNAVLIPTRNGHHDRVLSAAGVFAAFSTNIFGRKPTLHIHPANPAGAIRLNEFLHEGNPAFQEYCRQVAETGHGRMVLPLMRGQELFLESSLEAKLVSGKAQGLFHLLRMPGAYGLAAVSGDEESARAHEAEILLKESNHRIKNSITLAASLLQIQASELKSDKARAALGDSVNRMHTIAQLHEALYKQNQQDKTLDAKPYLEDILSRLRQSNSSKKIGFKVDVESHRLPTNTTATLGMLVNEIVQNSLKHAFKEKEKGLIGVSFYRIENMYYLSAEDNGGGISDSKLKDSDSLGSTLIEEFVAQLGGKLRLERQMGTRYLITFHAPNE